MSQAAAALRLLTFGGLSVQGQKGPLAGAAAQPRRLAVLVLVARGGERGVTRNKLLALLWPDSDDAQGRRVLSQALYTLRRDLGSDECIRGTHDLRLNVEEVWCDVAQFERALADGELEHAAGLYVGPFLDGFRLASAPEFERWADEERAAIQHRFHDAVEKLARAAEIDGAFDVAVKWWRRRAEDDPLNARVAVSMMRALAAAGDRNGALREARIFEALIAQELEVAPDRAVVELAESLRRERAPTLKQTEASVAVNPFTMMGAADEDTLHEWREGLTEELIVALSGIQGLRVAGRTSALSANAAYTIEGSVRFVDVRVRVLVRMVEAASGHTVWSERFDCATKQAHLEQENIATVAARALADLLTNPPGFAT
jgi:DNA-binding SARP family transcriptional activator